MYCSTSVQLITIKSDFISLCTKAKDTTKHQNGSKPEKDLKTKAEELSESLEVIANESPVEESCLVAGSDIATQTTPQDSQPSTAPHSGSQLTSMFVPIAPKTTSTAANREYVPVMVTKKRKKLANPMNRSWKKGFTGSPDYNGEDCFKCDICLKPFSTEYNLKRHKAQIKCKPPVEEDNNGSYKCDICLKHFRSEDNLKRHKMEVECKAPVEENNNGSYKCHICSKLFTREDNLKRHNTLIKCKPPSEDKINGSFKCDICFRTFASKRNLQRHNTIKCKPFVEDENKKQYECRVCQKPFLSINGRRKHEIGHGYNPEYHKTFKCSECLEVFNTSKEILNHYKCHPHIKLRTDRITFQNEAEFKTWKTDMEEKSSSSYIKNQGSANLKGRVQRYICHRSGVHQSKAHKRRNTSTVKSGYFCPSRIIATTLPCGQIEVEFTQPHVGHRCELHKLRLDDATKAEIAELMRSGESFDTILENIAAETDPTKRLSLIKRQDLRNLRASFGVKMVRELTLCRSKPKKNKTRVSRRRKNVPVKRKVQTYRCDDADWLDSGNSKDPGEVNESKDQTYSQVYDNADWLVPVFSSEVVCTSSNDHGDLTSDYSPEDQDEIEAAVQGINDPETNLDYLKEQAKAEVSSLIPDIESFTGEEQCKALLNFIRMAKKNRITSNKRRNARPKNKLRKEKS